MQIWEFHHFHLRLVGANWADVFWHFGWRPVRRMWWVGWNTQSRSARHFHHPSQAGLPWTFHQQHRWQVVKENCSNPHRHAMCTRPSEVPVDDDDGDENGHRVHDESEQQIFGNQWLEKCKTVIGCMLKACKELTSTSDVGGRIFDTSNRKTTSDSKILMPSVTFSPASAGR